MESKRLDNSSLEVRTEDLQKIAIQAYVHSIETIVWPTNTHKVQLFVPPLVLASHLEPETTHGNVTTTDEKEVDPVSQEVMTEGQTWVEGQKETVTRILDIQKTRWPSVFSEYSTSTQTNLWTKSSDSFTDDLEGQTKHVEKLIEIPTSAIEDITGQPTSAVKGFIEQSSNSVEKFLGPSTSSIDGVIGQSTSAAENVLWKSPGIIQEVIGQSTNAVGEVIGQSTNAVGEVIGQSTNAVGEVIGQSTNAVGEVIGQSTNAVGEVIGQSTSTVGAVIGQSTNAVGEVIGQSTNAVGEVIVKPTSVFENVVGQSTAAVEKLIRQSSSDVEKMIEQSTSTVKGIIGHSTPAVGEVIEHSTIGDVTQEPTSALQYAIRQSTDVVEKALEQSTSSVELTLWQTTSALEEEIWQSASALGYNKEHSSIISTQLINASSSFLTNETLAFQDVFPKPTSSVYFQSNFEQQVNTVDSSTEWQTTTLEQLGELRTPTRPLDGVEYYNLDESAKALHTLRGTFLETASYLKGTLNEPASLYLESPHRSTTDPLSDDWGKQSGNLQKIMAQPTRVLYEQTTSGDDESLSHFHTAPSDILPPSIHDFQYKLPQSAAALHDGIGHQIQHSFSGFQTELEPSFTISQEEGDDSTQVIYSYTHYVADSERFLKETGVYKEPFQDHALTSSEVVATSLESTMPASKMFVKYNGFTSPSAGDRTPPLTNVFLNTINERWETENFVDKTMTDMESKLLKVDDTYTSLLVHDIQKSSAEIVQSVSPANTTALIGTGIADVEQIQNVIELHEVREILSTKDIPSAAAIQNSILETFEKKYAILSDHTNLERTDSVISERTESSLDFTDFLEHSLYNRDVILESSQKETSPEQIHLRLTPGSSQADLDLTKLSTKVVNALNMNSDYSNSLRFTLGASDQHKTSLGTKTVGLAGVNIMPDFITPTTSTSFHHAYLSTTILSNDTLNLSPSTSSYRNITTPVHVSIVQHLSSTERSAVFSNLSHASKDMQLFNNMKSEADFNYSSLSKVTNSTSQLSTSAIQPSNLQEALVSTIFSPITNTVGIRARTVGNGLLPQETSYSSYLIEPSRVVLEIQDQIVKDSEETLQPTSVLSWLSDFSSSFTGTASIDSISGQILEILTSSSNQTIGTDYGTRATGIAEFFQYGRTAAPGGLDVLKVSTSDQAPFVIREPGTQGDVYSGFVIDLLTEVARRSGFAIELFPNEDGQVGAPRGRNWSGVIGDIREGKAQIGAGAITITSEREEAVDFSKPFMSNSINLLVEKPEWSSIGLGYLTRPFSSDYWIMVLVCLLLVGIVFFLIGKFSPYEWGNVAADRDPRGAKNSFTFRNSYLFALSTISWQGFREAPKSLSGRIMAAFWFLFVLFTLVAYTGNLTAYLLARPEQIPDMPFKSYEELLESSDITIGAVNFGTTQEMLRKSRSETLRSLWSKINSVNSWVEDYEEGVQRAESSKGRFVMFMESASAEYYARKHCNLMLFGENLFPTSMAFALPKASVYKKKINEALRDMNEDGFTKELINKYWRFGGSCSNVDGRKYVQTGSGGLSSLPIYPITLKDMSVAILLFFLGMVVAFIFLAIEIVHYAVTKKGKKIERPNILKNPPKIFRGKKAAKPAPEDVEGGAGPSSSGDALESVPLEDAEEPAASSSDELRPEGDEAAKA